MTDKNRCVICCFNEILDDSLYVVKQEDVSRFSVYFSRLSWSRLCFKKCDWKQHTVMLLRVLHRSPHIPLKNVDFLYILGWSVLNPKEEGNHHGNQSKRKAFSWMWMEDSIQHQNHGSPFFDWKLRIKHLIVKDQISHFLLLRLLKNFFWMQKSLRHIRKECILSAISRRKLASIEILKSVPFRT